MVSGVFVYVLSGLISVSTSNIKAKSFSGYENSELPEISAPRYAQFMNSMAMPYSECGDTLSQLTTGKSKIDPQSGYRPIDAFTTSGLDNAITLALKTYREKSEKGIAGDIVQSRYELREALRNRLRYSQNLINERYAELEQNTKILREIGGATEPYFRNADEVADVVVKNWSAVLHMELTSLTELQAQLPFDLPNYSDLQAMIYSLTAEAKKVPENAFNVN